MSESDWMTPREVAAALNVAVETVRKLCVSGDLRNVTIGTGGKSHRRVRRQWLESFLKDREQHAASAPLPPAAVKMRGRRNLIGL